MVTAALPASEAVWPRERHLLRRQPAYPRHVAVADFDGDIPPETKLSLTVISTLCAVDISGSERNLDAHGFPACGGAKGARQASRPPVSAAWSVAASMGRIMGAIDEAGDRAAFVADRFEMGLAIPGAAAILHALLVRSGSTVSRSDLAAAVGFSPKSITSYVSLLRLELDRYELGECLETVRGRGYRISTRGAAEITARLAVDAEARRGFQVSDPWRKNSVSAFRGPE